MEWMGRLPIRLLTVLIVLAIVIPVTLVSRFFISRAIGSALVAQGNRNNFLILNAITEEIGSALYHPLWNMLVIGRLIEETGSAKEFPIEARAVRETFPHFMGVCLLSEEGVVKDCIPASHVKRGIDLSREPSFREAKGLRSPTYYLYCTPSGQTHIHLIVPFRRFMLLACIDTFWLEEIFRKIQVRDSLIYLLIDRAGRPILGRGPWMDNPKGATCVVEGLRGRNGPFQEKLGDEEYVTYASTVRLAGMLVCIGEKRSTFLSTYTQVKQVLLLSFFVSALVAVLMGILLAGRVANGIRGLAAQASRIGKGEYEVSPVPALTKEVADIGSALSHMAQAIKERERLLKAERDRFRDVVENLPLCSVLLDGKGRILHVNRYFKETLGYNEGELKGRWLRLLWPDRSLRHEVVGAWKAVRNQLGPSGPFFFPTRTKDGRRRIMEFHGVRERDMFCVLAEDVTEEREMTDRFRNLFSQSRDAIFFVDKEGKFIDANRAAIELYGCESKEEFLNMHVWDIFATEEERKKILRELRQKGFARSFETLHRRKDGSIIHVRDTATAIYDEKGEIKEYIGIVRDVTQLKRLEEQFLQAQKMEVVGRLTGGIAHDFNNMLTVVMGGLQMVQTMLPPDHPAMKYVVGAYDAAEKSASFVKQLLAFSRRQIVDLKPVNVNDLVADLAKVTRRSLRENIELEIVLTKGHPIVRADLAQMNQMLLNLMVNAQDAMESGGRITIETHLVRIDEEYVRLHPESRVGEFVVIAISDTGVGIPTHLMDRIFEPFFTTKKDGTGLGLSVCYGIVRQHGGFINVYSEVGRGTTFKIYLPLAKVEVEQKGERVAQMEGGSETILLVEDDERVRRVTEEMLKKLGYRVVIAKDGEEAVSIFEAKGSEVDFCLIDLVMPKKGGMQTFQALKAMRPDLKVLFMTGYTENAVHSDFVLKEGFQLISKPFTIETLAKKLRDVLEGKP